MKDDRSEQSRMQQVNSTLDDIERARAQMRAQPSSVKRSLKLAELANIEASCWEVVVEHSRTRAHWRAALVARAYAQHTARLWLEHAAAAHSLPRIITRPVACREQAGVRFVGAL